ncbi:MAG: 6-deoxyerythronolide-B synthase, partial [bacterium]
MNNENDNLDSAIAIIGMACRFPEANNMAELWQNLKNGIESIKFFSKEELLAVGIEETLLDNPNYIRAKAFLSDIDKFDASFFGYSPKEAELIDPQQRIFLELAWQALEIAGYDSEQYPGQIGVYAGIGLNTYLLNNLINNPDIFTSSRRHQAVLGNDKDFLPTRVSYKLNLTGPSMTVQTACSTSLVATCLACQSLLDYHSDIALAGGVSVTIWQKKGYFHEEGGIYSRDGHCRVFDAQSTGTAAGEGAGIVVLKRLKEALADGDSIYAVIKGFALNNDGSEKIGYTAPSVDGQANVIAEAQAVANVTPKEITYVETHGTGTILGDPIEI